MSDTRALAALRNDMEFIKADDQQMAESILTIHAQSAYREHTDTDHVWSLFEELYDNLTGRDLEADSRVEVEAMDDSH